LGFSVLISAEFSAPPEHIQANCDSPV